MVSIVPPVPDHRLSRPARPGRAASLAEAIGYVGGTLALVGLGIVAGNYWPDMTPATRAVAAGLGTAVFLAGGAAVREHSPMLVRLRSFMWFLATAAAGLTAQVLVADVGDVSRRATIALGISTAVFVVSALCWQGHEHRPLQLFTMTGGAVAIVGSAVAEANRNSITGLVVWIVGALLAVIGWRWSRHDSGVLVLVAGMAMFVGAALCTDRWMSLGFALGLIGASMFVVAAIVPGILDDSYDIAVFAVLGLVTLLFLGPPAVGHFVSRGGPVFGTIVAIAGAVAIEAARRRVVRVPQLVAAAGAISLMAGAAMWGAKWHGIGPILGILAAVLVVALSLRPGLVMLSIYGSLGLLIFVPWGISYWFPGRGRVPLLVFVAGVLLCGIAILLARSGSRFGRELRANKPPAPVA